jgi:adenine deaminase
MPRHFLGLQEIFMRPLAVLLILCASPLNNLLAQSASFDLVIRNGRIIDGTGSPWYSGDVGIRDGRIAAIGRLEGVRAERTVDFDAKHPYTLPRTPDTLSTCP